MVIADKVKYAFTASPIMKLSPKMILKIRKTFSYTNIVKKYNLSTFFEFVC